MENYTITHFSVTSPSKENMIPGNDINVDVEVEIFTKTPQNQAQISKFAQILVTF